MAAAAAIVLRKERDIVNTYRGAGALAPGSARDPDELGIAQRVPFNLLVHHRVLIETGGGRYYLDDARWTVVHARRRRIALAVLTLIVITTAVLVAAGVVTLGTTHTPT